MTSDQPASRAASGRRVARSFEGLLLLLNSIGTIWIFVLMVVINADVIGRTLFTRPLPGVPELVKLSIVAIVFLQIAYTVRSRRITRVDAFLVGLRRRRPRASATVEAVYSLIGAAFFIILLYACAPLFFRAWERGDYAGIEGYVTYPYWPVYLILLIGAACSALQYLAFFWAELSLAAGRHRGAPDAETPPSA
jgi:TRAP-type C4-dicarboxylate transport system permease small subunit